MEPSNKEDARCAEEGQAISESPQELPGRSDSQFSPSEVVELTEGKQVGSAANDITRDIVLASATTRGATFSKDKAAARSEARRELDKLLQDTYKRLIGMIASYKDGELSFTKFSKNFKGKLKSSYDKAYVLGLKSTGAAVSLTAGGSPLLRPGDRKWIDSAFREEMKYLNRFLNDIKRNKGPNRWNHRTGMYVATIGSVYYTGRVAATPPNYVLFWIAKLDARICSKCAYMAQNSPFTKFNLPITPQSGHTHCLSNCRCRLTIRQVSKEYFEKLRRRSVSRQTHLRRLRKLAR